jgi:uncharacterized phage protein (TIGR01671 family)
MREFKFRVWDTKHKKFLIGIPPMEYMLDHDEWSHRDIEEDPCVYLNNVFSKDFNGRLIFQQYTGLTDKNGKEIYEGDIIIDTQKQKYEIIFDENHARYDLKVCGENKLSQTSYFTQIYEKKHIEVIGNIFEHPELLN